MTPSRNQPARLTRPNRPSTLIVVDRTPPPPPALQLPKLLFSNVRSLCPKIDDVIATMNIFSPHVATFCETWLSEHVPNEVVNIPDYSLIRKDRRDRPGGGICFYIRSSVPFRRRLDLESDDFETVWITLLPNHLPRRFSPIIIGSVYHPPSADHRYLIDHIVNTFDRIKMDHPHCGIIICGDFNRLPKSTLLGRIPSLSQLVITPTRNNNVLDLLFTNMRDLFSCSVQAPIANSDHNTILATPVKCLPQLQPSLIKKRLDSPENRNKLIDALKHIDWYPLLRSPSCGVKSDIFYKSVLPLLDNYTPWSTRKRPPDTKPWISDKFLYLIKRRQKAWKAGHSMLYRHLRNKTNRLRKSLKSSFYSNKLSNISPKDASKWWSSTKNLLGLNKPNELSSLINSKYNGNVLLFTTEVNRFLSSVSEDLDPLASLPPIQDVPDEFIPTVDDIRLLLSKTNSHKAPGPDGLPGWLLRDAADTLATPIASIISASLAEQAWPIFWLRADILPIAKVHPPSSIESDLRPISLTCILAKVAERVLVGHLSKYIIPKIDTRQFGAIKNCSTTHALVSLLHQLHAAADSGKPSRLLLIDFSKAFDRIDINILTAKLMSYDIPPCLVRWTSAFLQLRYQRVKYQETVSPWVTSHAGVPQGTSLGPLAFLVMINDLDVTLKYVDDSSVLEITDNPETSKMSLISSNLVEWCDINNMKINPQKTKILDICFSRSDPSWPDVMMMGIKIKPVNSAKLLGVFINNTLTWDDHIHFITKKANRRVYFIVMLKRSGVSIQDIIKFYTAYIRPILEYACPVWHTSLPILLQELIESVQRRVLRIVLPALSYHEACKFCNIQDLSSRRNLLSKHFFNSILSGNRISYLLEPYRQPILSTDLRYRAPYSICCRTTRFQHSLVPYGITNFL